MTQSEHEFFQIRLEKSKSLKQQGIDPYPSKFNRSHTSKDALDNFDDSLDEENQPEISLGGRVVGRRGMGKATFIDLSDVDGKIQILMRRNQLDEKYSLLDFLDIGDWIGVRGSLFQTRTGQVTLQVSDFEILCKALRPLPEKWHG